MKKYKREEVYNATLEYFSGDTLASDVWINKYALKDTNGSDTIYYELTPDDMHRRLAKELNRIENKYKNPLSEDKIFDLLKNFKYIIPQGSPMSGIGNDKQVVSLSNCFVIGNNSDSYGSICMIDEEQIQLMKRRGGIGLDLSHIRPNGSPVKNSALTSTGVVPFMTRYSNSTNEVAQGGRRGASIQTISIKHPDSEEFIDAKLEKGKITGSNISVKITDDFMKAALNSKTFTQQFPVDSNEPTIVKEIEADKLWKKIIHNAWKSAEPGILFIDTIKKESVPDCYEEHGFGTISTNPCLTGDSLIKTSKGDITIKEIVENFNSFTAYEILTYNEKNNNLEYNFLSDAILTKRNANIIEIELEDGYTLKLTPDHKVFTKNRKWIEASKLTKDDILIKIDDENEKSSDDMKTKEIKIKKINIKQNEDVYDLKLENNHNFFANNILVHNCGEIPLCPYDSCRLLLLNLYGFVDEPFTKNTKFDFKKFEEYAQYAERFMDDIVDLEIEKIEKILEKIETDPEPEHIKIREKELWNKIMNMTKKGRRTGLGVTAEGDMLAALGLIYGTKESTEFSINVHKCLAINAYKSSSIMAKERGSFPIYDYEKEINNPFLKRLKKDDFELDEMLKKYGRRNISILTISPAGSVSILSQTTSGVEPCYLVSYKRRRKINPTDTNNKIDFIDAEGVKWEEYIVFHHKFETWLKVNNYDVNAVKSMKEDELKEIIKKSPYYKATSNDVNWVEKVTMQGQIQKYIDHSISVTVNLPNDATEEMVSKVYETGWKSGCKGITVYRDGSRQGVIVSKDDKDNKDKILKENNAKPRPKRLECDVVRFTNNKEKWIGFLGILVDGEEKYPYEIFSGLAESFNIPLYVEKGEIIKVKDTADHKRYDFVYKDKDGYNVTMEGLNRAFDREFWNTSKMVSALLRHRIHLPSVINIIDSLQMTQDDAAFGTWKSGIRRIIKKYINSIPAQGEVCPECGEPLIFENGCKSCKACGWSKC